ncbi:MAG: DUF1648 domain-containing protein [Peptoclostridium sp.]|uniref:SdpI family protein n=1 Tax=Peptoclostridium sp. TaxID=1904860 RepID=UPI00139C72D5|nr:SdpI family protein [Peptoclostridium sp.]MZQ75057.1 DUF1648 domain-containing protein [Peptoclostridium sp.]
MKTNKFILELIIISIIGTIFVYGYLPDTIPLHWNIQGEVDRVGGKNNVFITALLPLVLYMLMMLFPKIDPKKKSYEKHKKAYSITVGLILVFLIVIHWVTILVSLGLNLDVSTVVSMGIGVMFIVIGNFMSQIRQNYFFGIRTPWTLANENVWKKTHRVGGYGFIAIGAAFILSAFLKSSMLKFIIIVGGTIGFTLYIFIYSYFVFKKETESKQ